MENNRSIDKNLVEEEVINFKEIVHKIFSRWYLFGIFGLLGLAGAYTANKILQPNYEIQSTLVVKDKQENMGLSNIFQNVGFSAQSSNIQNQIGILSSYSMTRQALENLNWRISWYEDVVLLKIDLYKIRLIPSQSFQDF